MRARVVAMFSARLFRLGLAGILLAAQAAAERPERIVELAAPPVALLAPSPGEPLVAGSWVELAWEPLAADLEAEEWELFLSVDGGRSFAVRLTPHLDFSIRRLAFEVPRLESDDVRLLFRMGDEREEYAFRMRQRFAIRSAGAATAATAVVRRDRRGEPALEGAPGVALWSDGARDGSATTRRVAALVAGLSNRAPAVAVRDDENLRGEENDPETLLALAPGVARPGKLRGRRAKSRPRPAPARHVDLLTLLRRQNE